MKFVDHAVTNPVSVVSALVCCAAGLVVGRGVGVVVGVGVALGLVAVGVGVGAGVGVLWALVILVLVLPPPLLLDEDEAGVAAGAYVNVTKVWFRLPEVSLAYSVTVFVPSATVIVTFVQFASDVFEPLSEYQHLSIATLSLTVYASEMD